MPHPQRSYDDLVHEAATVSVDGWDFSWLDGRASEERPSWGYARLMAARMRGAEAALDLQTGGGEVLATAPTFPPLTVATEGWPPNLPRAHRALAPRGAQVIGHADTTPLPFRTAAFDLVVSRHPVRTDWPEVARVLRPGGRYLSQQVGPRTVGELTEFFLGPQPPGPGPRDPELTRRQAQLAGLRVTDLRAEELACEFYDVGAVVHFLRKVIWTVPDFTVRRYEHRLRALHEQIGRDGVFRATTRRFLIEAVRRG